MSQELDRLIEEARKYVMSPDEEREQTISFAYGNTHLENPAITREDVEKAMVELRLERESTLRS